MKTRSCVWLALLVLQALASDARADKPAFHADPASPLMDEVVRIQLSALPPGGAVTLRAQTRWRGLLWQAHASFVADGDGKVDVTKQAPSAGTYTGADPMGLFWSMRPGDGPPPEDLPAAANITDPRVTRLTAEIDRRAVATHDVKRWLARPGVRVSDVREKGLVGRLFEPEKKGRRPAVLVLSGSEGGMNEPEAALLASRGYTALALAYFGAEGLPDRLVKIPLESLKGGLDWLRGRDSVDGERIGVVGWSKGGELALLLGATFPEVKAVVAYVPSHVAWSGIGGTYREPSWTYKGKPVPYVQTQPGLAFFAQLASGKPVALLDLYRSGLEDEAAVAKARIPVEKINGAVLVISGTDDQMWPSALMADRVVARLKEHKHPHPHQHLKYEGAGHAIANAYWPLTASVTSARFALGGTPEANARALADSRSKVLRFWKDNLGE